jgi:hypothetical protein
MGTRLGDWFFFGALIMQGAIEKSHLSWWILDLGALAIGFLLNEVERKSHAEGS